MDRNALISAIMTKNLVVATPSTTLYEVKEMLEKHDLHHILVAQDGVFCGIISKTDLYRVAHSIDLFHSKSNVELNDRLFKSLLAEEVMAADALVLAPDDTVGFAAALFLGNQFHALPVVSNGKLVGIVTTFDLIKYAF